MLAPREFVTFWAKRMTRACFLVLFAAVALLLAPVACTPKDDLGRFSTRQLEVYHAMQAWTDAVSNQDIDAMWGMLSQDARKFYELELSRPGGVRTQRATLQAAIDDPHAILDDAERERIERDLAKFPQDAATMTAREYYEWQLRNHPEQGDQMSADRVENQHRLWHQSNISSIELEATRATVVLRSGDPRRYDWVREDDEWKFDVSADIRFHLDRWKKD
jgi:hypothetical protein